MATWRETTFAEVPGPSPEESFEVDACESTRVLDVAWGENGEVTDSGRQQAVIDFLGYSAVAVNPSNNTKYITRVLPHAHPDWPIVSFGASYDVGYRLWAKSCRIEPRGVPVDSSGKRTGSLKSAQQTVLANKARLRLTYQDRPYDLLPDTPDADGGFWKKLPLMPTDANGNPDESSLKRFVTRRGTSAGQYLHLPQGSFRLCPLTGPHGNKVGPSLSTDPVNGNPNLGLVSTAAAVPAPGTPGRIEPRFNLALTWHLIPEAAVGASILNPNTLLHPAIDHLVGHVNASPLWGYSDGCVLFETWEFEPRRDPFGNRVYDITFHFNIFEQEQVNFLGFASIAVGHNYLYYADGVKADSGYYLITDDGTTTGNTLYPAGLSYADGTTLDLDDLFRVPS